MADKDDKTEEPTGKRLEDSRKKGQIARSRELNTFVMLIASATMFLIQGRQIGKGLIAGMQAQFQLSREVIFDPVSPMVFFKQAMIDGLLLLAPFFALMVFVAIITPISMGGWVFSWEAIAFKPSKMNPITGIARMFAVKGLVELFKALLKILLVFAVTVALYKSFIGELLGLGAEPLGQSVSHALNIIGICFLVLSASLVLIVMIDVPYQLWEHTKNLKMSKQEIKDENKESEGSPETKGRQRRAQMEMSQGRMMSADRKSVV